MEPIPQPNGGALNPGGTPGNKGGTGRPPDEIRKRFREILAGAGTDRIEAIVDKKEEGDVLRAIDMLGKYGLGDAKIELEDATIFEKLGQLLPKYLAQEQCTKFLTELKDALTG